MPQAPQLSWLVLPSTHTLLHWSDAQVIPAPPLELAPTPPAPPAEFTPPAEVSPPWLEVFPLPAEPASGVCDEENEPHPATIAPSNSPTETNWKERYQNI